MRIVPLFAHNPSLWTGAGNHTYLVVAGREAVLVDAGTGDARHLAGLDAALGEAEGERGSTTLTRVLVTHGHSDHASGAPAIRAAHPGTVFCKYPWPPWDDRYAVTWEPLSDGSVVRVGPHSLIAIHTPGHSPDHLCFLEPAEGLVFGGDLAVKGSTVAVIASGGGSLARYLESLRRVIALRPRLLLPSHGEPIEDPASLLESYIAHRLARERQIVELIAGAPRSVAEIVARIYTGLEPGLVRAAGESVLAHLHKLRDEGRAASWAAADGVERWNGT